MLTTKYYQPINGILAPVVQVSLGPKFIRQRSFYSEEQYGYLWVMTQNPQSDAFTFHQVRTPNGDPYNWYRRSDTPADISLSNLVSLFVHDPEKVHWSSFAFSPEGELYLALYYVDGNQHQVEVIDSSGQPFLTVTNAKYPFLIPDFFFTGDASGNVNLIYIKANDTEIRYYSIGSEEEGLVTSTPTNFRNGLFLADYAYFPGSVELVYSTPSRTMFFVRLSSEYLGTRDTGVLRGFYYMGMHKAVIRNLGTLSLRPHVAGGYISKSMEQEYGDASLAQGHVSLKNELSSFTSSLQDSISPRPHGQLKSVLSSAFLEGRDSLFSRLSLGTNLKETFHKVDLVDSGVCRVEVYLGKEASSFEEEVQESTEVKLPLFLHNSGTSHEGRPEDRLESLYRCLVRKEKSTWEESNFSQAGSSEISNLGDPSLIEASLFFGKEVSSLDKEIEDSLGAGVDIFFRYDQVG